MRPPILLPDLILRSADRHPEAPALSHAGQTWSYGDLRAAVEGFSGALIGLGLPRGGRVGIYLEKRLEAVVASFASPRAAGVFVPINPLLKAPQVEHILRDCNVHTLVTSRERFEPLMATLAGCPDLKQVVLTNGLPHDATSHRFQLHDWKALLDAPAAGACCAVESDMAAILYTSGSTGKPKGVVLSHRNLVAGATSVAAYLENGREDALLAVLPLSFDAGFSQLTTAFLSGARAVLLNHLLPRDVINALRDEGITGLTAVPPLYIQLAQLEWPQGIDGRLRYFASTGGRMPRETLQALRQRVPGAKPYLMYGLTEAFRSTYLAPEEVDRRPDSIGRAIPNAEILVLRPDGTECAADEPGELVHRGPLVGMGYWNDAEKTAERFRPLPSNCGNRPHGLMLPEMAVFSGDTVRRDAEGFLYFIGRQDEMIKTSGYRVSPTEVEELVYGTRMVGECAAFGVPDDALGQRLHIAVTPPLDQALDVAQLLAECRTVMPAYMVPAIVSLEGPLPRSPNGKIDRKRLRDEWLEGKNAS